jgi:hypothetical protein
MGQNAMLKEEKLDETGARLEQFILKTSDMTRSTGTGLDDKSVKSD